MSKETKQEWINLKAKNERERKYYNSAYSDVVKLDGNLFYSFQKPNIKTEFCFGHGQNGITTDEEMYEALDQAKYARTNENYFLNENLSGINEQIKLFELYLKANCDEFEFNKLLEETKLYYRYDGAPYLYKLSRINNFDTDICFYSQSRENAGFYHPYKNLLIRKATKEDIETILNMLYEQKEIFIKRLNTYLKRYGLTKVRSWDYIVD